MSTPPSWVYPAGMMALSTLLLAVTRSSTNPMTAPDISADFEPHEDSYKSSNSWSAGDIRSPNRFSESDFDPNYIGPEVVDSDQHSSKIGSNDGDLTSVGTLSGYPNGQKSIKSPFSSAGKDRIIQSIAARGKKQPDTGGQRFLRKLPDGIQADDPARAAAAEEIMKRGNVSSYWDAILLLNLGFISAVGPQKPPDVSLQLIFPSVGVQKTTLGNFKRLFNDGMSKVFVSGGSGPRSLNPKANLSSVETFMEHDANALSGPGAVLQALCNDTFKNNVVTVLHFNNPNVAKGYSQMSFYLLKLLDSIGMPVISWDSEFSAIHAADRQLQLAPSMYQQTEAMLAFMKKYSWKYFSMVTTGHTGSEDFVSALKIQESASKQSSFPNKFGQYGFEFKILSEVYLQNAAEKEEIKTQLYEQLDPDTRIILLHAKAAEALNILEVAEELGLTGREYVWILTSSALGERKDGDTASRSIPMGLFAVTYSDAMEDMREVIKRSIRVWFQAIKNMENDGVLDQWQWNTEVSCGDKEIKRWKGGQILYDYLKNVTLPATKDDVATEFNEAGMVLHNKLSILNVMRRSDYVGKKDSSASLSSLSSSGSSTGKFPGIGGRQSSVFASSSLFGGLNRSSSVSSLGEEKKWPSSSASSSSSSSSVSASSGSNSSSSGRSSLLGSPRSGLQSSSGGLGASSASASNEARNAMGKVPSGLTRHGQGSPFNRFGSPMAKDKDKEENSSDPPTMPSEMFGSVKGNGVVSDTDRDGSHAEANFQKSSLLQEEPQLRHWRNRHRPIRHHRLSRSTAVDKMFQEVATWDGTKLLVREIIWPGNSSFPPKGFPESYHLNVVTYVEEPHVTSKPLGEKKDCDAHATRCLVFERDEKDNRLPGRSRVERCCSGLSIDILHRISKELRFSYNIFEVESLGYGSAVDYTNNTQWNGLVGAVLRKEADVAVAALTITPEREEVIDFSVPFLETGITIVVAIREGAISPTAFLEPYDYPSWTLILVFSVHATGASIFIFEWLSPYGLDQGHTPLRVHKFSLFRSFWLIWAMLFGAAVSTDMPRGVSSRFLANIWALFAVVFLASYTANLAAFMITKEEYYDLSGIQDWRLKNPHHRHPPFKYATMPNGSTETNIKKNHPDLYVHMKKYPQYTVKEAVTALKEQKIQAFIYDATTLEYAVGRDIGCKLKSVGKRYAETGYGVGFPKKSRWIKKFNEVLLKMQNDGEIERLQKFWLAGACHKKTQQRGSSSHTLGILNFTSAFILLGGGVVLGALLLMLEHIYFRFGRKSLRKWDKCGCCSLVSLSMGQSLTFEQSVMEAIDLHKYHKCRDPLCETQLWKAKHELDIALLKIDQLKRQIEKQTAADGDVSCSLAGGARAPVGLRARPDGEGVALSKYNPDSLTLQKGGVPRKRSSKPTLSSTNHTPSAATSPAATSSAPAVTKPSAPYNQPPSLPSSGSQNTGGLPLTRGFPPRSSGVVEPVPLTKLPVTLSLEDDDSNASFPPPPPDLQLGIEDSEDGSDPPSPRTSGPRRTRVSDGKIYENVNSGVNIDIESTI